jgi:hypothetical protein
MKTGFRAVFLLFASAAVFAACSGTSSNSPAPPPPPELGTSTFLASGGTSTSGTGGSGGYVYAQSYGAIKVLKSGTVDASFDSTVSMPTLSFGDNHYVVSSDTTVLLNDDMVSGNLCTYDYSEYLYIGDGSGTCDNNDTLVTGLTVNAGVTLALVYSGLDDNTLWLSNDIVVYGTITADLTTNNSIYIEAKVIDVENGGKIISSATTTDSPGGYVYLGYNQGMTKTIINRGTIEAKGLGSGDGGYVYFYADDLIVNHGTIDASAGSSATGSGGNAQENDFYVNSSYNGKFYNFGTILAKGGNSSFYDSNSATGGTGGTGGYIYVDVPDLVVNTGTIDVSGGSSDFGVGGSGGTFDVYVYYGDFYSSGTVLMNGGKGGTDGGATAAWGEGDSALIWTAYDGVSGSRKGDIIISGTWEANGGDGDNGNGGAGGYIYLETDAWGAVTINASMSIRGGNGSSGGGSAYGIDIYSYNSYADPVIPGKISIAGQYDLRGGNGDESGGDGGYLRVSNNGFSMSNVGSDVELMGFPTIILNGGDGANGGSAASYAFQISTNSPNGMPAGPITNEANIEARGGNAAATPFSSGGSGGIVEMLTTNGIGDPSETLTNSGNIDISGGTGDTGGSSSMINMGAQHVTNPGNLTANGGNVTTGAISGAGSGGNIYLNSYGTTQTTYTGTLSVKGGTPDGSDGSVNIDSSGPL